MEKYIEILLNSYSGYFNYLKTKFYTWTGITILWFDCYFTGRMVTWNYISLKTSDFTKDFWLDLFYIFFQFFLLNLILLIALSNVMEQFINDTLHIFGFELMSIQLFQYQNYHKPSLYFHSSISDFIQWNVHRLLHTFFMENP
jgi:hypothetical protein